MQRYFLELAYRGTDFCGWQAQSNSPTVQAELERVLSMLLQEPVRVTGAGRTDAGVHAPFFVAHFDAAGSDLHVGDTFVRKLNQILSKDIVIYRIIPVSPEAHARFDALSRTYLYRIATRKNPFTKDVTYLYYRPLDMEKMNEASGILPEYKDFTSFSKLHGNAKTNLCNIYEAYWEDFADEGELRFTIRANRFLRNMVRAIVGSMMDIGAGKIRPDDIRKIIEAKDRGCAGMSAPPQGLHLIRIDY